MLQQKAFRAGAVHNLLSTDLSIYQLYFNSNTGQDTKNDALCTFKCIWYTCKHFTEYIYTSINRWRGNMWHEIQTLYVSFQTFPHQRWCGTRISLDQGAFYTSVTLLRIWNDRKANCNVLAVQTQLRVVQRGKVSVFDLTSRWHRPRSFDCWLIVWVQFNIWNPLRMIQDCTG